MARRRIAVALISILVALLPSLPAAGGRLDRIEEELQHKRNQLERVEEERHDVAAELRDAQGNRKELAAKVHELGAQLDDAQARLAEVETTLEVSRHELKRWTAKLERARAELRQQREVLGDRASAAYKFGPGAYLNLLLGADDLRSFSDRATFLESVLTVDSDLVAGLEVTEVLVGDRQDRVESIESRVEERFALLEEQAARIAAIEAQQQAVLSEIDLEIEIQGELLEDIDENRERYEQAVADLQAESERISAVIQSGGSSSGSGQNSGQNSGQSSGEMFWPTSGSIASGFGWRTHPIYGTARFHSGVDIGGACGQPIWAANGGRVISAGWNGGYGNTVIIDHGGGVATLYAHQTSFAVSSGAGVNRGQTIGYVGTTGLSTGCHLHFEVRINGAPVDPVPYLT
jgi:murein DD-endopeptidase MepM/ murein hydrolase activator NlpD